MSTQTETAFASLTHARYANVRDQIEQLQAAAAAALRQAERLDLDLADTLTPAEKLTTAEAILRRFWATT